MGTSGSPKTALLAVFACLVPVSTTGCEVAQEERESIEAFIDDLHLTVSPESVAAGDVVTFFVNGEPPIKLRARRYVDLLSVDGELLYRLNAATPKRPHGSRTAYPLPSSYSPPPGVVPLASRQRVRLPPRLEPGQYELQTDIVGLGSRQRGQPRSTLQVVDNAASP